MQAKHTRRDFVRILFAASQAALAGRFLSTNLLAQAAPDDALNFLIFGDWGRRGEKDQMDVAAQMALTARDSKASFIVSVGDNFYDNGVTSTKDELWKTSFEQVYTARSLQVPWEVILGNHDYHGNCDAQIEYSKLSPRWIMPARYFLRSHAVAPGVVADFFYIDTTPMLKVSQKDRRMRDHVATQDVPKQLEWLDAGLGASRAQWKFVIGHHPIYSGGGHGDTPELIASVLPLLHKHKVQAYFNGHDHDLQHLVVGALNFFDSGAGSKVNPTLHTEHTKFAVSTSGFTAVALQADKMTVRMIDDKGKLLYTTMVPRSQAS